MLARKHVANELGQNEKEHCARIVELMRKSAHDVNKRRDERLMSEIDVAAELRLDDTLAAGQKARGDEKGTKVQCTSRITDDK